MMPKFLNVSVQDCWEKLLRGDPREAPQITNIVTFDKYLTKISQYGYQNVCILF